MDRKQHINFDKIIIQYWREKKIDISIFCKNS